MTKLKYISKQNAKRLHGWRRMISLMLVIIMFFSDLPSLSLSAAENKEQGSATNQTGSNSNELIYDYDTLKIMRDGKACSAMSLYEHEKIEVQAEGLTEDATYQWQVQHPEKDDVWVNIYDGTQSTIGVSLALVGNVLREDGTAKVRCRAYTDTYAYLSDPITVTLISDDAKVSSAAYASGKGAALLADGDPAPEFVTVTIEYIQYDFERDSNGDLVYKDGELVYDEGKQAFTSYMATIHGGSDLKTTVHFPTMVGYDSYFGDGTTPSTSYTIDLTGVTANVVYTVKYLPAEVDYVVRYYFQNIYDDLYVEDVSMKVNAKGRTGSVPPESIMEKVVDGFTPLYYQPDAIAADGSTVFEVYYERNYYLMEFDCDGGYGTETLYVRYGAYISVPVPVRHGYVFGNNGDGKGWDLYATEKPDNTEPLNDGHGNTLPGTMPAYNSVYKAIWDVSETSYTVVYWRENANDNGYSYWDSLQIGLQADGVTYDGTVHSNDHISGSDAALRDNSVISQLSEHEHFTYNEKKTLFEESKRTDLASDGKIVVEGDGSTVINVYFSRKVYTLTLTDEAVSTCQIAEHEHTEECYEYICDSHVHSTDCYVCKLSVHTHSDTCCSLYHVHSASCGYACGKVEHTVHDRGCYTFTGGTVAESPTTGINPNSYGTYGDVVVYRRYYNYYQYQYYVLINGSYYQISNFNNNFKGTLSATDCPNTELHIHNETCGYACGKTPHTHAADEICDVLKCPNGGEEHDHTPACYLCNKEEVSHTTACCSKEPHTHTSCSAANCKHKHTVSCYTSNTLTPADNYDNGFSTINAIVNPEEGRIYRYRSSNNSNNNTGYHNYIYLNGVWYYLSTSNRTTGTVGPFTWEGDYTINRYNYAVSNTVNQPIQCNHSHEDKCYTCGKIAHTHDGNSCDALNCTDSTHHSHSDACYLCDQSHVHTEKCPTVLSCGLPEHNHSTGHSGLEGRIVKIIQAKYGAYIGDEWSFTTSGGITYPKAGKAASWMPVDAGTIGLTQRLAMIDVMPGWSFELYDYPQDNDRRYYNYYIECLDGEEADVEYDGKRYRHYLANGTLIVDFNRYTKAEDFFPIEGFTQHRVVSNGTIISGDVQQLSNGQTVNFYYNRKTYKLKYFNYNDNLRDALGNIIEITLSYQEPLAEYNILKEDVPYPGKLEPGAYEFVGWFTTPECFPGTEVDWVNGVMPDVDEYMEIYAKWSPVLRTVTFYSAFSDIAADAGDTSDRIYHFMKAENVPHGTTVGSAYLHTPEWPEDLDQATNGGAQADLYDFVGWFYMDEDNKKKFAPDSMEITRDLVLFAEWQTTIDTTYTVDFVLKEDASEENTPDHVAYPAGTKIAETIFAHSTVGKTKTFAAKGLGELLPAFRKKFFPTVNSHSILMEPDGTLNTYTFEYIYDDTVYYKVRYVDYSTRTEIAPSKVNYTDEAIITEKFLPISGYLPQSYYIRKALAYDGNATAETVIEENTITFYYIKDTEHGLYSIEYYLENVDSTNPNDVANYYQYETIVGSDDLIVGGVQNRIKAEIRKYEGFTHMPQLNTVITYDEKGDVEKTLIGDAAGDPPEGPLDYTGLTIRIYYQRNEYPYIIEYREYGAAADKPALMQIADGAGSAVIGDKANYDSALTHTALPSFKIDGQLYEYYIDNPTEEQRTKSTTIRKSDDGKENKLVFYYKKHEVTVIYSAVCKTVGAVDYGIVSLYSERAATAGGLSGSTAIPGVGYRFVGWYTDAECTNPVDPSWRYTPGSPDVQADSGTKLTPGELDATKDEVQYYALFEPIVSSMEISNTTSVSTDDTFLFRVQGIGKTAYIDITIAIQGSGSTVLNELPVGEYLVTELTGWSWEYDATVNGYNVPITESGVNKTEFSNTYHNSDWLNGECYKDNAFTDLP